MPWRYATDVLKVKLNPETDGFKPVSALEVTITTVAREAADAGATTPPAARPNAAAVAIATRAMRCTFIYSPSDR